MQNPEVSAPAIYFRVLNFRAAGLFKSVTLRHMKKHLLILMLFMALATLTAEAQCSLCTKTAQQLGEKPAEGMNSGILYLMATPFVLIGFIGYRWWKGNQAS
jgi:L-lactate permease